MMCVTCDKTLLLQRLTALAVAAVSVIGFPSVLTQNIPTYYLDDYCSRVVDMTMANVKSGRLMLHRPGQNPTYTSCHILIKAPSNKRLNFKFHFFDVMTSAGCQSNFLRIFEDHQRQRPITEKLCNSGVVPDRSYITNGAEAAVWLNKENYLMDQVELVFTAFSFSPCVGGDHQCDNDHCISSDLYCNDEYDNCGDESDICLIKHGTVVGIVIAVVVLVVILAILLALYMFRRQRKIRREKVADMFSISSDQKSQLSFVSEGKSSTLIKQPSLVSGRGRYPELRTVAFVGTKAHSLGYYPLYTPVGSRYSTLSRYGGSGIYGSDLDERKRDRGRGSVVYGSNLGEKTRSSIRSKPSLISKESYPADTIERRRRPVGDLRPPFYFDKDGYFSDSSVSQTNSLDKTSGRLALKKKDGKKKRKLMGKLKKKSKKEKNEELLPMKHRSSSGGGGGKINPAFVHKETMPHGREEMTEDVYIESPLVQTAIDIPEIRVTNADEEDDLYTKHQRSVSRDSSHARNNVNAFVGGENNENISTGTSVKSAEAFNELRARRQRKDEDLNQSRNMEPLKVPPRRKKARAMVHHTPTAERNHDVEEDNNRPTNIETIVEESPGYDTVDAHFPTHISALTLPEKTKRKERKEKYANHDYDDDKDDYDDDGDDNQNDIETVVVETPGIDTVEGNRQTHISAITFPGKATTTRKKKNKGSISYGEDETDYPQTNFQMADDQALMSTTSSSLEPTSPRSASGALSPARQRGLSARHPDGSPFLIHKVRSRSAERQLKQHPEDGADVRDHVISFRSYPAPVHVLEKAGLFRNSARRSTRFRDRKGSV